MADILDELVAALTSPLSAKDQEKGIIKPPPPSRILFEGTLEEAYDFYQQAEPVAKALYAPIAVYTDGLPIVVPTEEKVKKMLTGTSHSPEEVVTYQDGPRKGEPVVFARTYTVTVENVATVGVMAGCKPEHMPVLLAVATAEGGSSNCPGTSGSFGYFLAVSGPIARDAGMNAGQNALDVGNPANMCIARAAQLMTINFGRCTTGVLRSDNGGPIHIAFAEDADGLPPGWEGLNEDWGYNKKDSVLVKMYTQHMFMGSGQYAPSSFRGLITDGYGGMARYIGVEGIPGPHNFLEYLVPRIIPWHIPLEGHTFVMTPAMAKSLYDYGFKTKQEVYEWLFYENHTTVGEWKKMGWYDFRTAGGENIEPSSGIKYKDLPDDYMIPAFGQKDPKENLIIVTASGADEMCYHFNAPRGGHGSTIAYPIDPWR